MPAASNIVDMSAEFAMRRVDNDLARLRKVIADLREQTNRARRRIDAEVARIEAEGRARQ